MRWLNNISFNSALFISCIIIAGIIFFQSVLPGVLASPTGESLIVHVAYAKAVLNGTILHLKYPMELYPAANEVILAIFLLLRLPLNSFDVLGIIFLFTVSVFLGQVFKFKPIYSYLFGLSICLNYGILRYALTQVIDVWLLAWFLLTLALLYKPKANTAYYILLGLSSGMLLGSRFTAPATLLTLFIFYFQNFLKCLNIKRLFIFITIVSIVGGVWYVRNFVNTGDPFYPQSFLMFKGACVKVCGFLASNIWKAFVGDPKLFADAFISEYMIWALIFVLLPIFSLVSYLLKQSKRFSVFNKLILLGMLNLFLYLFFPSGDVYIGVVAGIRYSYPVFGIFMLALFIIAEQLHMEELLGIIVFVNITFLILPFSYHPKFLYLYVPLITVILYSLRIYYLKKVDKAVRISINYEKSLHGSGKRKSTKLG